MAERKPAIGEELDVRVAWRRDDPAIEADAIAFWERLGLLPEGVEPAMRAKEIVAAAYKDGALIALETAALDHIPFLKARMAVVRAATDPAFRRSGAQLTLAAPCHHALRDWARAHPEERVAGAIGFVEPAEWGEFVRLPVWPGWGMELIGYTQENRQIRARWFDFTPEDAPKIPATAEEMAPGFDFRFVWKARDMAVEADAIAFWERLGILPRTVTPEERAKELVSVVYKEGRLVAVVTGRAGMFDQVRARLAFLRGAVDPDHRRGRVGFAMMLHARAQLELWSATHPEARLAGIGGFIEADELRERGKQMYWPTTRFGVVGFMPDGRQIRISWFRGFRLD